MATSDERELLPANVRPCHYTVELEPNFETLKVAGTVSIDLEVLEDSTSITLHSRQIQIEEAVLNPDARAQKITDIQYDDQTHMATFSFEKINAGSKAILFIKFESVVNDEDVGIFRRQYDENGTRKTLICTNFQPVETRRAYPCFDEPALKASFDFSLIADSNLTVLANTALESQTKLSNGKSRTSFIRTPLMCTYLLAFVIGELTYAEFTNFRIPLRIYSTPSQIQNAQFSLNLTVKALELFETVFDLPFPLSKLDQVAIPGFIGGMEYWGLIFYDSSNLLLDQNTASATLEKAVAKLVTHELAHQWFGNIVTMKYWDGLWLNEGFAEWACWYCCDKLFPDEGYWKSFLLEVYAPSMDDDSLSSSHPVEVPILKASLINQLFDSISYRKGASIVRMIANFLGQEVFLRGVANYLRKYAYSNTVTNDLWDELSKISNLDVQKIMSVWTQKAGYPVLTVTESKEGIHIEQNRFFKDNTSQADQTIYPVALQIRLLGDIQDVMLDSRTKFIPLKELDFFKLNAGQCGLYRTLYTPERFKRLADNLELLPIEERIGLMDDVAALSSSGYLATSTLLDLLYGMRSEADPLVWSMLITSLSEVSKTWKFASKVMFEGIKKVNRSILGERSLQLGWEIEKDDDAQLAAHKASVFEKAGFAGEPSILEASKSMFASYSSGNEAAINPNLLGAVFGIAIRFGGKETFDAALKEFRKAPSQKRRTMLKGLSATVDPECIQSVLSLLLSDEVDSAADVFALTTYLQASSSSEQLWSWLQESWDAVLSKVMRLIVGTFVSMIIQSLGTEQHVVEVKAFFFETDGKTVQKRFEEQALGIKQGLEGLEAKVKWNKRDSEVVTNWLGDHDFL